MANINLMYGLAECNSSEARRLYADRYPSRLLPDKQIFQRLDEPLQETGSFKKRVLESGSPMNVKSINCEERILNHIEEHNRTSTLIIATMESVGHISEWRVLREQQLYLYHIKRVQTLQLDD